MSWFESILIGLAAVAASLLLGVDIPIWGFAVLGVATGAIVAVVRRAE